ncbi:unnamed protein product, partial [Schistocephalus solidus]|uniref:Zf-CHCC domain-containing protein n=1 Tax=Schistocephalus solidus TaxID=70667 RepID=A0A183TK03_SCHSO
VNQSFAVDLISKVPAKKVTSHIACCDGGGGALGHPKVYINLVSSQVLRPPIYQNFVSSYLVGLEGCVQKGKVPSSLISGSFVQVIGEMSW